MGRLWGMFLRADKLRFEKISAHRCHLSAMPFQETLSSGLRASLAMNSHSAACFKNSSGGCIGSLLSLTSPIPVVRIKTNSAPEQPTLRNGSYELLRRPPVANQQEATLPLKMTVPWRDPEPGSARLISAMPQHKFDQQIYGLVGTATSRLCRSSSLIP